VPCGVARIVWKMIGNVSHLMITNTKERVVGFMISSIAATEDVRTRRFLFSFRAAWRMESVPEIVGSIRVLERVEADGAFVW